MKKREQEAKEEKEDLIRFLEEYLRMFKNDKEHKKVHKKEPCGICNRAKEILKKLKKEVGK